MKGLLLSSLLNIFSATTDDVSSRPSYLSPPKSFEIQSDSVYGSKYYKEILTILIDRKIPMFELELEDIDVRLNMKGKLVKSPGDIDDRFIFWLIDIKFK